MLSSAMAVRKWRTVLGLVGFSKNLYMMMLLLSTFSSVSRVGNQLFWKSSSVSIVKVRYPSRPPIVPSNILFVTSRPERPASSSSHLLQYFTLPMHYLHPCLNLYMAVRPSSMYLSASSILILSSDSLASHLSSQTFMTNRATAHVDLRPMGPPEVCL